jgi:uncharacterized repeat protein (TIGR03803 family)
VKKRKQDTNHGVCWSAKLTGGWWKRIGLSCLLLVATVVSPAQDEQPSPNAVKFKTLVNFVDVTFGLYARLVQGTDSNLYGMTASGGANVCSGEGCGTVYKMTPAGTLTTIYNFCSQANCADGWAPNASGGALALDTDGNFYGATQFGGASAGSAPCAPLGCGTLFKITPSGTLTALYNFCSEPNCADGAGNYTGVVRGADGNFYGTMQGGGAISNPMCIPFVGTGCGTVFKVTPQGAFKTLYSFCSQTNCMDGAGPGSGLVSGADGELYGMAGVGGANCCGTIFRITLDGKLTTLHSFDGTDGGGCSFDCAPMIQALNGNSYGVTSSGGTGIGPGGVQAGVFFRITPSGTYTPRTRFTRGYDAL